MRYLLPLIALLFLVRFAAAQICPASPVGYERQYRPQGIESNYPPVNEPVCLWYTTSGEQP